MSYYILVTVKEIKKVPLTRKPTTEERELLRNSGLYEADDDIVDEQ